MPVIASNRINDPRLAEGVIEEGQADLVTMARALLADPDLPERPCRSQEHVITTALHATRDVSTACSVEPVTCIVNPAAGMETELTITAAPKKKRVLVVGGGPAGMKAAVTAADGGIR